MVAMNNWKNKCVDFIGHELGSALYVDKENSRATVVQLYFLMKRILANIYSLNIQLMRLARRQFRVASYMHTTLLWRKRMSFLRKRKIPPTINVLALLP